MITEVVPRNLGTPVGVRVDVYEVDSHGAKLDWLATSYTSRVPAVSWLISYRYMRGYYE